METEVIYYVSTMAARKEESIRPIPGLKLGHDRVDGFLESLRRDRVPSLLFSGPEGSGKEYTAIELARRLCCGEDVPCEPGGAARCELCSQAAVLEHPGIQMIYPTPTQGAGEPDDGDVTDISKVLDDKRQDIFSVYRFTKKASIRIARARAVIQRANTKPFGSRYNVFIFVDAHAMREEAQNALLKLVEEPPPHCVMIFVSHNPESILYTIRSRCQHVRFTPLKTDAVERLLIDYYQIDAKTARRAAKLSQGNLQRARALSQSFDDAERQSAAAFVVELPGAKESWVIGQALTVGRSANRDAVARYLHELSVTFRDVMAGEKSLMINSEHAAALDEAAGAWERKRLPAMIDRVARARYEILVRNMNIDATLVSLFLDLRREAGR
jgi:DNA polymerase III delta prime subunit